MTRKGFTMHGLKDRFFEPLTKNELYLAHVASLEVLERTGVKIYATEAIELLRKGGCEVDTEKELVKIPQHLVKECIAKTPSTFTLCGRNKEWDLTFDSSKFFTGWAGGVPYIHDVETQQRREGKIQDVADTSRAIDALSNIHFHLCPVVVPTDVPAKALEVHSADAALSNTVKHVEPEIWSKERIQDVIKIGEIVAGGEDELRKRPLISGMSQAVAPLQQNELQLSILMEFAKKGLPINIRAHPISGLSSPVTIAGELVMTNAENLSSLVIAQLTNPRTPILYGMSSSVADMRVCLNLSGAVEIGLLGAAHVQMARYYGIPSSYSTAIDSPAPDAQAATELIFTLMPGLLGGMSMAWLGANDLKSTFWYEQLLINEDIFTNAQRLLKGIDLSDETLAVNLINEVGPGGGFLNKRHTMLYYEKEHVRPKLFFRAPWHEWEKAGMKYIHARARERAREILKSHQAPPLDRDIREEMRRVVKGADTQTQKITL